MDIIKAFVAIFFGTWLYSYILSGYWIKYLKRSSKRNPA
jgi:hypothetical protein